MYINYSHWSESCEHESWEKRSLTRSDNVVIHVKQCLQCGANIGGVKRQGVAPPFDRELREYILAQAAQHRQDAWAQRVARMGREQDHATAQRKAEYQEYLRSNVWASKRSLVLKRCNYVCEACLEARATQVHHERYPEELGTEPLFWLRGICRPCHEQIHNVS